MIRIEQGLCQLTFGRELAYIPVPGLQLWNKALSVYDRLA